MSFAGVEVINSMSGLTGHTTPKSLALRDPKRVYFPYFWEVDASIVVLRNTFTTMFWMWTFMVLLNLIMLNLVWNLVELCNFAACLIRIYQIFARRSEGEGQKLQLSVDMHINPGLLFRFTPHGTIHGVRRFLLFHGLSMVGPCYHLGRVWLHPTWNREKRNRVGCLRCGTDQTGSAAHW